MLEEQTRIPPVDVETLPDDLRDALEAQRKLYGAPPIPISSTRAIPRTPAPAKAMWAALQQETKRVPIALGALHVLALQPGVPHPLAGVLEGMRSCESLKGSP